MTDLTSAALRYAGQGRAVFPCNGDKTPRVTGGFKAATVDGDVIEAWDWNSDGMIGAEIPTGQIVVDIDPRNGGLKTLALLPHDLPPTKLVTTRSGGSHAYYTVDPELALRGSLGPGVDIKIHGKGYVIVPPSEGYVWAQVGKPQPAPQWLLDELVVVEREASASEAHDFKGFVFETGTAYGMAALEREIGKLATTGEGGRNHALNKAAFALSQLVAGGELREDAALESLSTVALQIGLEPDEIKATIESAWHAGEIAPRQAPPRADEPAEPFVIADAIPEAKSEENFWTNWEIDEPAPPFYIWPMLPKNAYVMAFGATESAKSMAWVGLLCEASHRGIKTSVYSLENPPHTDRDRLRRWNPHKGNFRLTNEPIDFNDPRQLGALVAREKAWGTDVLMLDTYSHAFNSRSEDGNAKAIEFARRVRAVMHEVGCSVVLVDHTGYAQQEEPRDASAKRQQVDVCILMKKAGEWRPGQPARFTMKNMKSARFANPFFMTGEIRDVKGSETRGLTLTWMGDNPRWEPEA